MTREAAEKYLSSIDFVPGKSTTKGITGEKRAKIKKACHVLATTPPAPAPKAKPKAPKK